MYNGESLYLKLQHRRGPLLFLLIQRFSTQILAQDGFSLSRRKNDLKESFWNWIEVSSSFQTYLQPHSPVSSNISKPLSKVSFVLAVFVIFELLFKKTALCFKISIGLFYIWICYMQIIMGTFQGKSVLAPYVKCFATSRDI